MKSITEILGGCQMIFGISFDIQEVFKGYVTVEPHSFIQMLQVIEEFLPVCDRKASRLRRKGYDETAMIRSALAKQFFKIPTVTSQLVPSHLQASVLRAQADKGAVGKVHRSMFSIAFGTTMMMLVVRGDCP